MCDSEEFGIPDEPPERPDGIQDKTWNTYSTLWYWLKENAPYWLLPDGRISDSLLLMLIIRVEFNNLSDISPEIYELSLAALSNQYFGYGCGGGCSSLGQQLFWLDKMQGWYNQDGQLISIDDCLECWKDAARVKNGIYNPTEAFWWGNPAKGSPMEMYIDGTYEGDDWIAGIPYISYIDISAYGGDYNYFLVVTWNQNNACGAVNCMGFKD